MGILDFLGFGKKKDDMAEDQMEQAPDMTMPAAEKVVDTPPDMPTSDQAMSNGKDMMAPEEAPAEEMSQQPEM